MQYCWAKCT